MTLHTGQTLLRDLDDLGVRTGDLLFIHSSFKSMGPVAGGAQTVVDVLDAAVGPTGLLLLPSFNLIERDRRAEAWNIAHTPSTVGWLTEFFRRLPDTSRSDHYSHSVAARGDGAAAFVADHRSAAGLPSPWDKAPWGKTYGTHSPMYRAYDAGGKLLMIGVDYQTSTYLHLVEVLYWHTLRQRDPQAPYPAITRPRAGLFWEEQRRLRHGRLGDAPCRLFDIRSYVDTVLQEVENNPGPYTKK